MKKLNYYTSAAGIFLGNFSEAATAGVLWKKLFSNISLYSKESQTWNFIKKRIQHRCFRLNIAKFFRAPILKSIW